MDDAERIPIDLGYEVASAGEARDQRTTAREDGTIVIDILAPQPCAPEPSTEPEIVVCAVAPDGDPPLAPNPPQTIGEALNVKAGPLELGSIDRGDGTRAFGARVRF